MVAIVGAADGTSPTTRSARSGPSRTLRPAGSLSDGTWPAEDLFGMDHGMWLTVAGMIASGIGLAPGYLAPSSAPT